MAADEAEVITPLKKKSRTNKKKSRTNKKKSRTNKKKSRTNKKKVGFFFQREREVERK